MLAMFRLLYTLFGPTFYPDLRNVIVVEKACESRYHNFWLLRGNKILGICKILSNKLLRCELWVDNF